MISPREAFIFHFSVIRMGSRGTFVLCTARSRIDAAERRPGEGPYIYSTSVDRMQSVPSAVRQASPSLSPSRDRFQYRGLYFQY